MLKQMWRDLSTGWGTWRDWGLGLVLIALVFFFGVLAIGVPTLALWYFLGLHPDAGVMIVLGLALVGVWAYSAYERSQ